MKITPISDLHLEFFSKAEHLKSVTPNYTSEGFDTDVIILGGDIHIGTRAKKYIQTLLSQTCKKKTDVIMILGNHEFYHNDYNTLEQEWRELAFDINTYASHGGMHGRFYFLEKDFIVLQDVAFLGTTLWTDMDKRNPMTIMKAKDWMTDFTYIKSGSNSLPAERTVNDHERSKEWLVKTLSELRDKVDKVVVITHHSPSLQCILPHYKDNEGNGYFHSDLDEIIYEYEPCIWINGHMHDSLCFINHNTLHICNPYGYHGYEHNKDFNKNLTLDLEGTYNGGVV